MPPAPKHNWLYLYDVYQILCKTDPGAKVSGFARSHGLSAGACREAFRRIGNKKTRTVRTKNTRTNARKATTVFDDVSPEEAVGIVQQICDARLVEVHAKILTILCTNLNHLEAIQQKVCERDEAGNFIIKIETVLDAKTSVQVVNETTRGAQEIMPFIIDLQERAGLDNIISKLMGREYDVTQASLEVARLGANLPEALKIMLAKTPPVVIAQNFEAPLATEELDQRALEAMEGIRWQYEHFLPERREEIIELKMQMKGTDSGIQGDSHPV